MSGKRKRLSAKEKAIKLLEIYHTSKDVFTLQQIEKAGAAAGVVMNTIKDINQELVNDGQVETDKIGNQCYFWYDGSLKYVFFHFDSLCAFLLSATIRHHFIRLPTGPFPAKLRSRKP